MRNRLCEVLGIQKPIMQGPMSWVSTAPLAAAVCEAGGFGVLCTAAATPDFIEQQVRLMKEKTDRPFAVNMGLHPAFLPEEYFQAVLDILKREKVAAVHLDTLCDATMRLDESFARHFFDQWKEAGIKIIAKVFTVEDALTAQRAGADVIIAKGWEGGGHTTMQTTMVQIPQMADVITVPLVASGGIADGRGMAAALIMGADGIEMGTAFLAAEETDIHPRAKQAVLQAKDFSTVEIGSSCNMPCRQLRNALTDTVEKLEQGLSYEEAGSKVMELTTNSLRLAMKEGEVSQHGAVMAGQIVGMVKSIRPAGEIIDSVLEQCRYLLDTAPAVSLR